MLDPFQSDDEQRCETSRYQSGARQPVPACCGAGLSAGQPPSVVFLLGKLEAPGKLVQEVRSPPELWLMLLAGKDLCFLQVCFLPVLPVMRCGVFAKINGCSPSGALLGLILGCGWM